MTGGGGRGAVAGGERGVEGGGARGVGGGRGPRRKGSGGKVCIIYCIIYYKRVELKNSCCSDTEEDSKPELASSIPFEVDNR